MPEFNWTFLDYAVMGVMLASVGVLYWITTRRARSLIHRAAAALAVGTGFLTVWALLAVGILAEEGHPADLLYVALLAWGLRARLRPGCARRGWPRCLRPWRFPNP